VGETEGSGSADKRAGQISGRATGRTAHDTLFSFAKKLGVCYMKRFEAIGGLAALTLPLGISAALAEESPAASGSAPAREIVAREVAAFNAHDATAVTKFHAPSAALTIIPSGKAIFSGADQSQAFFAKLFKDNPNIRLTLNKQYVFKNVVTNHYNVSGGTNNEVISIYEVQNDVITNEWIIFG
jgi:hypothetical protein